jgi:hypothetical protein
MDKSIFVKFYSNLPLNVRKDVVLYLKSQPITWEVAYREINAETQLSEEILEKLIELKFIPTK